ncbi:MAG: hypothetical protein ACTSUE_21415 [Promethearchaeota archaeon]
MATARDYEALSGLDVRDLRVLRLPIPFIIVVFSLFSLADFLETSWLNELAMLSILIMLVLSTCIVVRDDKKPRFIMAGNKWVTVGMNE